MPSPLPSFLPSFLSARVVRPRPESRAKAVNSFDDESQLHCFQAPLYIHYITFFALELGLCKLQPASERPCFDALLPSFLPSFHNINLKKARRKVDMEVFALFHVLFMFLKCASASGRQVGNVCGVIVLSQQRSTKRLLS